MNEVEFESWEGEPIILMVVSQFLFRCMEYTPVILCDSRTTVVPQFLMKTLQKQAVID